MLSRRRVSPKKISAPPNKRDVEPARGFRERVRSAGLDRKRREQFRKAFADHLEREFGVPVPKELWSMVDDANRLGFSPASFAERVADAYGLERLPSAAHRRSLASEKPN